MTPEEAEFGRQVDFLLDELMAVSEDIRAVEATELIVENELGTFMHQCLQARLSRLLDDRADIARRFEELGRNMPVQQQTKRRHGKRRK
jgi:hypothetical protein